jgi:hypothetical protein
VDEPGRMPFARVFWSGKAQEAVGLALEGGDGDRPLTVRRSGSGGRLG